MRWLLVILTAYYGANGAFMLAAPGDWYLAVPGVTETGPANIHFIRDIGFAFLAAAAALLLAARRGAPPILVVPACVFLIGHAGLHVAEMVAHGAALAAAARDIALIVVPALLPLGAYWRMLRRANGTGAGAGLRPASQEFPRSAE